MPSLGLSRGSPRLAAFCLFVAFTAFPLTPSFGETFEVPSDRARTISQAIALADADLTTTNDVIEVATGNYVENLKVSNSLTIRGKSGAKVVVRAASSDPAVTVGGTSAAVTIEGLILTTGGTGVLIENSPSLILRNLVITGATTAIQCNAPITGSTIAQVTFFDVDVGVNCATSIITIRNSIFSNVSVTPIASFTIVGFIQPARNLFWNSPNTGERGDEVKVDQTGSNSLDPKFVDTTQSAEDNDFHLQEGSGAIETGLESFDLGAYGGLGASDVPFPPAKPAVTCTSSPPFECTVSWPQNLDYAVGGYQVLSSAPSAPSPDYGTTTPVNNAAAGCAGAADPPVLCSTLVGSLLDTVGAPATPAAPTARFGDSKVQLDWPAVSGATAYEVYVQTAPNSITPGTPDFTVSSPTNTVEGLANGTAYYFAVTAVNQPTFYAAVKSVHGDVSGTATLAVSELSEPADPVAYGTAQISGPSPEVSSTPQPVVAFPPLEDTGGCFIATAAYGSSLAPQVDVLRTLRERYLRPYALGGVMIRVYETWSPPIADVIRSSDALRFAVRALLWPLVGLAWMTVYAPWWAIIAASAVCMLVLLVLVRRRGASCA
jgi:hypothetical protein